jgi:hypothetical protein
VAVVGSGAGSKCPNRPDCPCDFCFSIRAEIAEGRSEKDEQDEIAEDSSAWIRRPSLRGKLGEMTGNNWTSCFAAKRKRFVSEVVRLPTGLLQLIPRCGQNWAATYFDVVHHVSRPYKVQGQRPYSSIILGHSSLALPILLAGLSPMEKIQRIKELYRELNKIDEKMKPFLIPQTVQDREWTQEDADEHLKLHQRQGEIIKELADLERGHI